MGHHQHAGPMSIDQVGGAEWHSLDTRFGVRLIRCRIEPAQGGWRNTSWSGIVRTIRDRRRWLVTIESERWTWPVLREAFDDEVAARERVAVLMSRYQEATSDPFPRPMWFRRRPIGPRI